MSRRIRILTSADVYSALDSVTVDDIAFDSESENEPSDDESYEVSDEENSGEHMLDLPGVPGSIREICLFTLLFPFPTWLP